MSTYLKGTGMNHYSTYTASDFILDNAFVAWTKKPTPEQNRFWQQWLIDHPDRASVVEEARFWIQSVGVDEKLPTEREVQDAIRMVESKIATTEPKVVLFRLVHWAWGAAAAVLILVGIGWYRWSNQPSAVETGEIRSFSGEIGEMVAQENQTDRPQSLTLPDGSRVVLSPNSKLIYLKTFANELRAVNLTGEAFFDVVRRPRQPFVVRTGKVNVRVLGTSFIVRAYRDASEISVLVKSGRVAVSKAQATGGNDTTDGVLITPNQQVSYSLQDNVFRKSLVAAPILVNKQKREADFVYDEIPVDNVFKELSAAYGVDIVYDPGKLTHCTLTARLSDEPMYQKLNMICQAIGATHETVGTQIVIHSNGCEE